MNRTSHAAGAPQSEQVDFGFRQLPPKDHRRGVADIFARVAPRYDLMNDLMSGGLHRLWKAALIDRLHPRPGETLIDLAGGTGDVAFAALTRAAERSAGAGGGLCTYIADASPDMLAVARDRALDRGLIKGLQYICADAAALPIATGAADACTIAFGLRNVTHRAAALAEIRRILKPGGRFLCLEFSHVALPLLKAAYDAYSFRVLPWLGQMVAGDGDSYRYLAESIRRFPDQARLAGELDQAGFSQVRVQNMSGGIVAIHSGWRL